MINSKMTQPTSNFSLKDAKITPLSIQQYAEISNNIYDEIERVDHHGLVAAKCIKHPEYGDIILISSPQGGCLMIHLEPTRITPHKAAKPSNPETT